MITQVMSRKEKEMRKFLLDEVGMSPHLCGFTYMAKALVAVQESDNPYALRIGKDILTPISQECQKKESAIERGCRNIIERWIDKRTPQSMKIIDSVFHGDTEISLKRFVFAMLEYKRLNYKQ